MTLLAVGVGQEYTTIAAAVPASAPGDTIAVQGGPDHVYTNDFFTIQHSLTVQAVGGEMVMVATAQPPNGNAMNTEGLADTPISVSIIGFDISGVTVPDNNGAAIRYEGGDLTWSIAISTTTKRDCWAFPTRTARSRSSTPSSLSTATAADRPMTSTSGTSPPSL